MIASLLVADRGEIACRIIRTARALGIRTIAVATEADRSWPHAREADETVMIGAGPAAESYLSTARILAAAQEADAAAIHPGYGGLAENAYFAEACAAAGFLFVGPPPQAIRTMRSKAEAKTLAAKLGIPILPGYHGERQEPEFLRQKAYETGYPVLIKAVAGGGGKGMHRVDRALDFDEAVISARREAENSFGDGRVIIERFLPQARHVETQIFADAAGNIVHFLERDCSLQVRRRKIIEEAPASGLPPDVRAAMHGASVKLASAIAYRGAGTVEFILDASRPPAIGGCYFLAMNTRLQVEHPVTEMIAGVDLVEWQIRVAAGEDLPFKQSDISRRGHAVEARICAENPAADFQPTTGRVVAAAFPARRDVRVEAGVDAGTEVGTHYGSLLAKVTAAGATRTQAIDRLAGAIDEVRIAGPRTNLGFLSAVLRHPAYREQAVTTDFVERHLESLLDVPFDATAGSGVALEFVRTAAETCAEEASGPWARIDGFEVGGLPRSSRLDINTEGHATPAELSWGADGPRVASIGGLAPIEGRRGEVIWSDGGAFVLLDGVQTRLEFPDHLARPFGDESDPAMAVAPTAGRIAAILVSTGDAVKKGDLLFVLEAMTLEHGIHAAAGGTVRAVFAIPGTQVEQGTAIVDILPADGL